MFCTKCGAENTSDSKFCLNCGNQLNQLITAPAAGPAVTPSEPVENNSFKTRTFLIIMSILYLVSSFITFVKITYDLGRIDYVNDDSGVLLVLTTFYGLGFLTLQILAGVFGLIPKTINAARGISAAMIPASIVSIFACLFAFIAGEYYLNDNELFGYTFLVLSILGPLKIVLASLYRTAALNTSESN